MRGGQNNSPNIHPQAATSWDLRRFGSQENGAEVDSNQLIQCHGGRWFLKGPRT